MKTTKRRRLDCRENQESGVCIIHAQNVTSDEFTFIRNTKNPADRFQKILSVKERRLLEPHTSPNRMNDICEKNPDVCEYNHGYHRACYSMFTGNLNRLKEVPENEPSTNQGMHMRRQSTDKDKIIFKP